MKSNREVLQFDTVGPNEASQLAARWARLMLAAMMLAYTTTGFLFVFNSSPNELHGEKSHLEKERKDKCNSATFDNHDDAQGSDEERGNAQCVESWARPDMR